MHAGAQTWGRAPIEDARGGEARRHLAGGGAALVGSSFFAAGLGAAYWFCAAHLYAQPEVGRASALVAAMMSVSAVAQLNFARSLSWLLARAGERARDLLAAVYALIGLAGLLLGAGFALLAPRLSGQLAYLGRSPGLAVAFAAGVCLFGVFALQDTVLTATRRTWLIPVKSAAFGVLKLPLLLAVPFLAGGSAASGMFLAWMLPLAVIVLPVGAYLSFRVLPSFGPEIRRSPAAATTLTPARALVRYDLLGTMLFLLGTMPLSVAVLGVLGPSAAAAFYVAMMVASTLDLLTVNLGNLLTSEMARSGGRLTDSNRLYARAAWLLLACAGAAIWISAPHALQLFGPGYRSAGTGALRLLMIALPARAYVLLSVAQARAQGRGPWIAIPQGAASVGTLALGILLMPRLGLAGIGAAWLLANCVAAVLAAAGRHAPSLRARWGAAGAQEALVPALPARPAEAGEGRRGDL